MLVKPISACRDTERSLTYSLESPSVSSPSDEAEEMATDGELFSFFLDNHN